MAEEENKEDKKEDPAADNDDSSKEGDGAEGKENFFAKNKLLIILGSVLLVLIIIISVLVVMIMKPPADPETMDKQKIEQKQEESKDKADGEQSSDTIGSALFIKIEPPFIVNFDSASGAKFLQVTIEIMVRSDANYKTIESLMPIIKNDLIKLLSSQSYDELRTPRGKELLRDRALKTVQDAMKKEVNKPVAEDILFTSFVMQ